MPKLNLSGLSDIKGWEKAGVDLPEYDAAAVSERTLSAPRWVHFGAGNLFRGYIAAIADTLLRNGDTDTGIIAVEAFDTDIIEKIYTPFDNLILSVSLYASGNSRKRVLGSVAKALTAENGDFDMLAAIFKQPSLQMASFTITEKGYDGAIMDTVARLLYERFSNSSCPLTLLSMDNFNENGERLRAAVLKSAAAFGDDDFIRYINEKVAFPWSMIDKITPRPSEQIGAELADCGVDGTDTVITSKNTYIAPFVNSESSEYLVIEDSFSNGRPPLERSGVYMTDRETVMLTERMKVTACLNPLHTALAVYGCLLGYTSISAEMQDDALLALVKKIGYGEGLPVAASPKIIEPEAFIDEVINERLPNPFIPDTPQRIATDTSQKIPIRFVNTIKAYQKEGRAGELVGIPLAVAGWLRYLKGVDDLHNPFTISPDPMLKTLINANPADILGNKAIFDTDLSDGGLDSKILSYYRKMEEKGGVRKLLNEELGVRSVVL